LEPGHFWCKTNFSRLIGKRNQHKKEICYNCLTLFDQKKLLAVHHKFCKNFKPQSVKMPNLLADGSVPTIKKLGIYVKM